MAMGRPILVYILPLLVALNVALEDCASRGLLAQATLIATKVLARLKGIAHARASAKRSSARAGVCIGS
jgi:hypothetical protein